MEGLDYFQLLNEFPFTVSLNYTKWLYMELIDKDLNAISSLRVSWMILCMIRNNGLPGLEL